jgi:hypothetical protein
MGLRGYPFHFHFLFVKMREVPFAEDSRTHSLDDNYSTDMKGEINQWWTYSTIYEMYSPNSITLNSNWKGLAFLSFPTFYFLGILNRA